MGQHGPEDLPVERSGIGLEEAGGDADDLTLGFRVQMESVHHAGRQDHQAGS